MRLTGIRALGLPLLVAGALTSGVPAFAQAPPRPAAPVATAPAQPVPPQAVPVPLPEGFVIGPEDVLGVLFWRDPDMSGDVTVRPDGMITLPLIGDIKAVGVRPDVLAQEIQKASSRLFTAEANVTIVVRQINSRKVFITGQVRTPGAYPLVGPRTVLQLIALAGGLNEYARGEKIKIMRSEQGRTRVLSFNYNDVSQGKALDQNAQLLPGDTVVVP